MSNLEQELRQFTGTTQHFQHWTGLQYTDGIKYLAQTAKAYWLIDLVASYQSSFAKHPDLEHFQLWELTTKDSKGLVSCAKDSGVDPSAQQMINYTDFPLSYIKLYVCNRVLMLPSEY